MALTTLIEEPMLAYIDDLNLEDWDTIKLDIQPSLSCVTDYTNWAANLKDGPRNCAIKIIPFLQYSKAPAWIEKENYSECSG